MKFVEFFAGIGGFGEGFKAVGGECVFANEWDKFAVQTYKANNPDVPVHAGDVRDLDLGVVPPHDVLLAGFPCQPFSKAGISSRNALGIPTGLDDKDQGNLFMDIVRFIASLWPEIVVLENVGNFLTHDGGRTFRTVVYALEQGLGYRTSHRVMNAAAWVPQDRRRVFIVAMRDGRKFDMASVEVPSEDSWPVMSSVLHREGEEDSEPPYTEGRPSRVSSKYVLSDKLWRYLKAYRKKHSEKGNGFGYGVVGPNSRSRTLPARYGKDGSEILVERAVGNPRRLTPRECARLMGFGNDFVIPVSDTQAYKQFGNAVVAPVSKALAEVMVRHLR